MADPINLTNVTPLNVKLTPLTPEQMKERGIDIAEWARPRDFVRPEPPPPELTADSLYAEIKVNGKTVAKVFNSGAAETPNGLNVDMTDDGQGPNLAQIRAEEIARAIGGKIVTADTAQTQSQWLRSHAEQMKALEAWKQSAGYGPNVQAELLLQAQQA